LTLVIVPAVFTLFDDIEHWVGPKATRLLAGKRSAVAGPTLTAIPVLPGEQPKLAAADGAPESIIG
jgi:hypothetical protein